MKFNKQHKQHKHDKTQLISVHYTYEFYGQNKYVIKCKFN